MKRYKEIDFARAIPLLIMPIVHVFEEFEWWSYLDEGGMDFATILMVCCVFGPAIFMCILGMNIAFSSHTSPAELAKRGVITIGVFFAHNLVRFLLPALTVYFTSGGEEDWAIADGFSDFCMSDILFFAGSAFLFFALMKKINASLLTIFIIALLMLTANTLFFPSDTLIASGESEWYSELLGNIFHVSEEGAFPMFTWMLYPVTGYAAGLYMKKLKDEKELYSFYGKLLVVSAVSLVALCACMYSFEIDFVIVAAAPINANITDLFSIMLNIPIAGIGIAIAAFIYRGIKKIASQKVLGAITDISKAIMVFYIIQWIIIGWMEYMMYELEESYCISTGTALLIGVAVTLVSLAIAIPIQKRIEKKKAAKYAAQATA